MLLDVVVFLVACFFFFLFFFCRVALSFSPFVREMDSFATALRREGSQGPRRRRRLLRDPCFRTLACIHPSNL